ncbi:hypothetical protein HDU77_000362 [Chytriomyces hyalinus]|nr:hypothetical protein HDU77_000362 [Chytriomyces hyalinus]
MRSRFCLDTPAEEAGTQVAVLDAALLVAPAFNVTVITQSHCGWKEILQRVRRMLGVVEAELPVHVGADGQKRVSMASHSLVDECMPCINSYPCPAHFGLPLNNPLHRFDYIDVDDFIDDNWVRKLQYSFIFFLTVKSVLVYTADLTILAFMIDSGVFTNSNDCGAASGSGEGSTATDLTKGFGAIFCINGTSITSQLAPKAACPWIMLASVIMSVLLLLLDWRKGRIVIKSRDISYSLTNHVAYRYYVLKSYPHCCFCSEILNSRKSVDVLAFFVFFAFKSWKRLFLAEFPRVYINVLHMYDVLKGLIPGPQIRKPDQVARLRIRLLQPNSNGRVSTEALHPGLDRNDAMFQGKAALLNHAKDHLLEMLPRNLAVPLRECIAYLEGIVSINKPMAWTLTR